MKVDIFHHFSFLNRYDARQLTLYMLFVLLCSIILFISITAKKTEQYNHMKTTIFTFSVSFHKDYLNDNTALLMWLLTGYDQHK